MKGRAGCALLAASLCACAGSGGDEAGAPACRPPPGPAERCVVPSTRYEAGPFQRFLLGSGYRDLWATPIVVPLLDLDRTAGGLEPVRELGHGQSATLALRGADGRAYSFRTT
ncbi:MAG TPA: hypothetical protein VHQ66_15490, partial [Myxococcota bacterium]|nr:hypothetical protein [Myxococcota bacterium]